MLVNIALTSLAVSAAVVATPVARDIVAGYEVAPKSEYEPASTGNYGDAYESEYAAGNGEYLPVVGEVVDSVGGLLGGGENYGKASGYGYAPKEPVYAPKSNNMYAPKEPTMYQAPCKKDECGEVSKEGYASVMIPGEVQQKFARRAPGDYKPVAKDYYAQATMPKDCAPKRCQDMCTKSGSGYKSMSSYESTPKQSAYGSEDEETTTDEDAESLNDVSRRNTEEVQDTSYDATEGVDCLAYSITASDSTGMMTCSLYDQAIDPLVYSIGSSVDQIVYNRVLTSLS